MSQAFLSSDFLKVALNGIIGLADGVTKLIDTFGVLPTLIGTFAGGLSLFKNQGLFKFEKDTKSIKLFGTQLTDLKGKYTQIHTAIDRYNSLSSKSASFQATYNKNLANSTSSIGKYLSGLKGANASMGGYITSLVGAKIASFALQAATMALNMALTMGISALISWGISKLDEWIETSDELAERIDEVTTKYKEQHNAMMKIKGDYNTSNEDSLISKYGELSKGVDSLGKNVSLTTDEYEEYRSIVSTIADQMPSLVTGYNSQGDAILSCSGSVDKLAESYRNLIKEQNSEVLKTGSDIFKDYKNDLKETTAYFRDAVKGEDGYADYIDTYNTKHFDTLKELNNLSGDELEKAVSNLSYDEYYRISQLLEERGLKRDVIGTGDWGYETYQEHIVNSIEKDKGKIKSVLAEASADLDAYAENLGSVTESYFSTAFLGGDDKYGVNDYSHLSEKLQGIITQVTSSFDSDFYTQFLNEENPYEALTKYFNDMLTAFDNLGSGEKKNLEAAFDLQTQFNGGEISYGEYVNGVKDAGKIIDNLELGEEVTNQLKLSLNTEEVEDNYEALKKRLTSDEYDIKMNASEAEEFLDGLTASEYAVAVDLIVNGDIDLSDFNIDSLRDYIEEQAKLQEAMNFTIAMDVETESIEAFNTAMSESVSAAGLSSDSIAALKGRYAELAEQGYDLSSMFEETANGIHLNREAVSEFEQKLASDKLSETEGHLTTLKGRYDELTEEIKNCTDAGERANLYTEQQQVAQKINDLATLASQYEGLTSAYNAWQNAESAGNERDMYENVLSGFETVEDELSRGWADDGTVKFLELITGETDLAGKSAKELKEIWNGLDDTIKNTSYSVKDFFTTDEDGNSTSKGVYNFLNAIQELESSDTKSSVLGKTFKEIEGIEKLVEKKDGKIVGFNFDIVGGDEAIAEALGISEELVQIMLRAADDAGFVVTIDGEWTQLADLKTSAEESESALKKLKTNGLDALKDFNDEDLDFNFDANNLESLNGELEKAMNVLDKFRNKDGTVNMKMEGAEEALEIASYFTATIDKLTEPVYMQLETNQVEENLQEPLTKMQEFERLSKEKHQLKLTGDTDGLKDVEAEMDEIAKYLDNLDEETKIDLEIDGLTQDEIKAKLEKGEIEIPATVDIQMEISEDIKDMRLLMMRELGLVSEEEVKLKIGYEVDDSLVDELDDGKKKIVIEYIEENEDAWNKLSEDERKIFIDLVASGVDIETLTDDETKEVAIEFVTENKDWFDKLGDEEKRVAIELVASGEVDLDSLTDDEKKQVVVEFISENEDEFDNLEDEEKQVVVDIVTDDKALKALEEHGVEIEAFCNIFGVEKVDDLKAKLEGLDDEQILVVAQVLGKIKVDELKTAINDLEPNQVEAIAKAIGKGDVDALKTAVFSLEPNQVEAIAKALGYNDVNELKGAMDNLTDKDVQAIAKTLGITDVDSLRNAINRLSDKDVKAVANVSGKSDVDGLKSSINNLQGKTVTVWAQIKQKASSLWSKLTGGGGVDGTAHVGGTAFANGTIKKSGRAYKQGDWGTKDSGIALGGEEAPELLVRNGRWHLIGEKGAEFFGYRKGDIIFNASQTKEIFEKGKITHGNGRGKALVSGTAFSKGTGGGFWEEETTTTTTTKKKSSGSSGGSSKSSSSSSKKSSSKSSSSSSSKSSSSSSSKASEEAEKFEETIDWIETKIARIERVIDQLDVKASNVYRSWSERNTTLANQISEVGNEIDIQQKAYDRYMQEANSIGLSETYASKVRNGTIDIETITDESLKEKIDDYQKYFEAALDCKDAIEELRETESELYAQRVENVATQYEGILGVIEHEKNMIEEYISQSEANAQLISGEYYKALISNENETVSKLQEQKNKMLSELQAGMNSGKIVKYTEGWYELCGQIDEVTLSIAESQTQIKEWNQTIQQLSWETFDLLQDKISAVSEEADFLIELMSSDKLHDDKGRLTDEGSATMGLHGQNYNAYMYQADLAAKEAERLKKQMSSDGYDTELEERYREMIALQQEYILNAQNEKEAIRDLVSDGIELELDALQELIDKKNEELESERDLYEYQKKVKEQTQEISSLEKQRQAYLNDDSESGKAKLQQIEVDLESARQDLEETEYDKYISDQSAMLDNLYIQYEETLNTRLDNLDALVSDVIAQINMDATSISTTLSEKADSVGYTLSSSMTSIWDTNSTKINSVITTYGDKFTLAQTTTNNALSTINTNLQKMITQLNTMAKTNVKSASTSSATNNKKADTPKQTTTTNSKPTTTTNTTKSIKVGGMVNASGAQIYDYAGDKSGERQYYRNDPKYRVLKENGNWIQVRWHKLSSGITGWFKKSDVKAYKTGAKGIGKSQFAWTQEDNKAEFIVRPSDGAILTPIAKGDSVLNANASSNIWNMANSPTDFIRDNLNLGGTNIPNSSNVNNNITQHIDANLNFPNVKSYEEMLVSLSRDPKFQKLVNAMTTDQYLGKSSLTKGKVIK